MWRRSCVALLLSTLLMLWSSSSGGVDCKPLVGLLGLFGSSNRTSVAGALLQSHLQQKISALEALAAALSGNYTG